MAVAPSFQSMTVMSEVFQKNGKDYIKVKNEKTGTIREVRWYTEKEYEKAYGKKTSNISTKVGERKAWKNLKQCRGFAEGPILVVRNVTKETENWLRFSSPARYAMGLEWHFASTDIIPDDYPETLKFIIVSWDEFKYEDDEHMKTPEELAELIKTKEKNNEYYNLK